MRTQDRKARVWAAGCVYGALLFLLAVLVAAPAHAVAAPERARNAPLLLPMDDSENNPYANCRHDNDSFYVPRDPHGQWFSWYCRNGHSGKEFRPSSDSDDWVNMKGKSESEAYTDWSSWIADQGSIDGSADFKSIDSPCKLFDNDDWDLERRQCAEVSRVSKFASPCEQWRQLIIDLHGRGEIVSDDGKNTSKVGPLNPEDDKSINKCIAENNVWSQKAWGLPPRVDETPYNKFDFSAPSTVVAPLNSLLGLLYIIAIVAGVAGIYRVAVSLATARRDGLEAHVQEFGMVVFGVVLAGGASGIAHILLVR